MSRTITSAHDAALAGDRVQPGDLVERVEHHASDARVHRGGELGGRLVVAVQRDPLGREPRAQARWPARRRCRRRARGPPRRPSAPPRCRGTPWPRSAPSDGAERGGERVRAGAEVGLVDHEQRGAVGLGEVAHVDARDRDRPRRGRGGVPRPDGGRQHVELGGGAGGAARPSRAGRGSRRAAARPDGPSCRRLAREGARRRSHPLRRADAEQPRPLASTWRAAAHSASRARCSSVVSSSPIGSTRQES